ncbi:MAG: electron transfer flavoprotein subunit beta/FixA family protein [Candidatus Binatia bacterium]
MRIAVCVKQVLDTTLPLRVVDGVVRQVARRRIAHPGPADCAALELALALRARLGGEVGAVSVGEAEAEEALRFCLARGVDRALQVRRPERLDPVGAARAVFGVLAAAPVDLVMAGAASGDGCSGLFPAVLAQELDWPLVTAVAAATPQNTDRRQPGRWLTVERRLEGGDREVVRCPLPAVLATDGAGVEVPYLALRAIRRAARMPIEQGAGRDSDAAGGELVAIETPRPRPKRAGGPDARVSAMDRLSHLLSGGLQPKRSGEFVEGSPAEVAAEIVRFLEQRGFIRAGGNNG